MAVTHLSWPTDHPESAKPDPKLIKGAELLSTEPWNTATDDNVGCEDMPRKSVDIKLTEYPIPAEKGQLRPFPAFRRGRVRAAPVNGSRGKSLAGS